MRRAAAVAAIALGLALPGLAPLAQAASAAQPAVQVLDIEGVINPVTDQYLEGGVRRADGEGASALVVRLNTPGGLESSMRRMVQTILAAHTPVVVYVTPSGGRAASAGMFITMAAHVAAMAPGTNIGAAHPVGVGGETDATMAEKLTNDAAALARSIAGIRGRNAEWAEQAVRESVSITAAEAREQNVIDRVAPDLPALLDQLDGTRVQTAAGEVTLHTKDAALAEHGMTFLERVLHVITDPNVAYILFTVGTIGLIAALYSPGAFFPGITGVISLILAFVAFGSLPINWAAVVLMLLAFGLLVFELNTEGFGVLGVGSLVAFVAGSLMLFAPLTPTSPAMPEVGVSPWLVGGMTAGFLTFFVIVLRGLLQAAKRPVAIGTAALVGRTGETLSELDPSGSVRLDGEVWTATAEDGPIPPGREVRVVQVEGVTLIVKPLS